jgi:hypothetical protein
VACEDCDYKSICRFDQGSQQYRVLKSAKHDAVD